jgi:hypothetical protein
MKRVYFLLAVTAFGINTFAQKTIDQKVSELLSKMTLEEKWDSLFSIQDLNTQQVRKFQFCKCSK